MEAKETLQILRHKMIIPISNVRTAAAILEKIYLKESEKLEEFEPLIKILIRAGNELHEALEETTGPINLRPK